MANSTQKSYQEQLTKFASELRENIDDEAMLQEIHQAIKAMLSGDEVSEREIRAVLQQHLDQGDVREESFQLMQKLIDNIVSEELPTATIVLSPDDSDPFVSTTVIPTVTLSPGLADQQLQVGSVLRDRFMLVEEIPGGNMGTVYKALDRRLTEADDEEHWVAVKVLSPKLSYDADALRALQQEAVKTRCLSHPNIVRFVDLDRDDDLYFMVMEWLEGRSLANILDDSANHQIDLDTALDIVRQVGHALDYAHLRGVIHADVKPGNIMITPSGQAKLFDFGIARIRQKQSESRKNLDPGILKAATPAYSSMQVLTGEEPVAADDVFSLGCLAYRLIAGYRVFGPRNAAEAAEAGMNPQPLENLSKSQWQALKKALAYSRVARYSSPAEFVKALTASTAATTTEVDIAQDTDHTHIDEFDSGGRKPWRFVVLVLMVAVAAGVLFKDDLILTVQPYIEGMVEPAPVANPANSSDTAAGGLATEPVDPVPENRLPDAGDGAAQPMAGSASEQADPEPAESVPVQANTTPPDSEPKTKPQDSVTRRPDATAVARSRKKVAPVAASSAPTQHPDFSSLPPANIILPLAGPGDLPGTSSITLVEDGNAVIIDFVRASNLEEALQLRVVEQSYNGNHSPLDTGQYSMSNGGLLDFSPGLHRARLTISMRSDTARESDHQVALAVLDTDYEDIELANIVLTLQDDDQRAYENRLAPNTVAFAVDQVSVRERDAAVHIDVIRFRADDTTQEVAYVIRDETTMEGDDYFAPHDGIVTFEPGQRSAKILIPLVQDSSREPDESFTIELLGDTPYAEGNIYRRITVMIRDDDS
jgi:protein kinase-like protein/Calx-beta domain-containing protein